MKRLAFVALGVQVVAIGCGKDSPTEPTPRTYTYRVTAESDIAAQAFACVGFGQEAVGAASADSGMFGAIEMGAGTCAGARTVTARGERGSVAATLPVGDSFVRFQNPGDASTRYRLTLSYLRLYLSDACYVVERVRADRRGPVRLTAGARAPRTPSSTIS